MKGKAEDSARGQVLTSSTAAPSSQSFPIMLCPAGQGCRKCTSWVPQTPAGPGSPGRDSQCSQDRPRAGAEARSYLQLTAMPCLLDPLSVCLSAGKHSASGSMRR